MYVFSICAAFSFSFDFVGQSQIQNTCVSEWVGANEWVSGMFD